MRRRTFLAACCAMPDTPLAHGIVYLQRKQSRDGAWRSETYGLLRDGYSLTPFVTNALLDAGAFTGRAIDFIEKHALVFGDDYPCYSAALSLKALIRSGRKAPKLVNWLREQQLTEQNGWRPEDAAYGAWGIGGPRRRAPYAGHVDISMTRYVIEGLAAAGVGASDPSMRAARMFIEKCRAPGGGYFFSPVVVDANKAGDGIGYGTATADAALSLKAAGGDATDALNWLRANDRAGLSPGFTGEARQRYAEGLRYYWAAVRRQTLGITTDLGPLQRADKSWRNSEPLVKEDDPLIATAFAVIALSRSQEP